MHSAKPAPVASRPYDTDEDLRQMQGMLRAARAQTSDWRYAHVGELQWNFFMVLCHLNPQAHIRLWHDAAGRLAGYALLGEDPFFECQVLPEYAGTAIEAEALAWAEARLGELRRRDAPRWGGRLVTGVRQDDAPRIAFLEQYGFRRGEYMEVNLLRALDGLIPEPVLPPGCQVRALGESATELSDRAAAQREVWAPWTVGNVSDADYVRFRHLPGYARDLDVVTVTPEGVIAAYVNGWVDPDNGIGDFGPVGARPAYRRQGLTRAALLESLRRMQAHGMNRVCISTGEGNAAARALYESVGFRIVNRWFEYVKPA